MKKISKIVEKKQKMFLKVLEKNGGNVTKSCKEFGICHQTYYKWRQNSQEFIDDADAILLAEFEKVEDIMRERIAAGSDKLIEFYIKSKAHNYKYKGYAPFNNYSMDLTTKGESINEIKIINLTEVKPPSDDDDENNDN